MIGKIVRLAALLLTTVLSANCSGLTTLTPALLDEAQSKWESTRPQSYRLVIEMKGDRVEKEQFEVIVQSGRLARLRRNGQEIKPGPEQDYSMDGLFRMLHQEMALAEKPALLGAPEGYSAYEMVRFDDRTGQLIEYRRTVGGVSNTIDIRILKFEPA